MTAHAASSLPAGFSLEQQSKQLASTRLSASFHFEPLQHLPEDLAGVLGDAFLGLMGMFYPRPLCRKANVVLTELITNVMENVWDPDSALDFALAVDGQSLDVRVSNRVSAAQYQEVLGRIEQINRSADKRLLLVQTLRSRRRQRLKGGLGLMRLASENKFSLSAHYVEGLMTVRAAYWVRDCQ